MDHIQDELLASQQGVVQELARANGELRHGDLGPRVTGRWKFLPGWADPLSQTGGVKKIQTWQATFTRWDPLKFPSRACN